MRVETQNGEVWWSKRQEGIVMRQQGLVMLTVLRSIREELIVDRVRGPTFVGLTSRLIWAEGPLHKQ